MSGQIFNGVDIKSGETINADVCIIGSGAGGGCAAAELAEGGLDVVVLEEGGYYTSDTFTRDPLTMITRLYRDGGANLIIGKPSIAFSEGRCVGGSTVINGGMCWRTPERVLHRWRLEFGLKDMTPEKMEPYFKKVEERIHVAFQHPDTISVGERKYYDAARRMGYFVNPDRRNQINCCGSNVCVFGCPGDRKQSTLVSYIPRAVKAGARVYADCRAVKIKTKNGRAVGVTANILDRNTQKKIGKLEVKCKILLLAGGALQTPVLLLKNRLANSSKMVGKNFLCHPNAKAVGIFDEPVYYWKGVHQGHQIHEFLDEGILLAMAGVHPALVSMSLPQYGRDSLKLMKQFNNMVVAGCLIDDTTTGYVRPGPGGTALMFYQIDKEETRRLIRGVALIAEILFVAGARKVLLPFANLKEISSIDEIPKIYDRPIPPSDIEVLTVHAMGTTAMGANPKRAVVNPWGETYDVKNMFIVDAGVIPTSISVNPQETIMALSTRTCEYILENKTRYLRV